jgi:hypothetical protein
MARNSTPVTPRTEAIDVTDPKAAKALAAAWRGVEQFFGGEVTKWEVLPPTEDHPDGVVTAMGFSIKGGLDVTPEQLLADLSGKDRRLEFIPFYNYLNGDKSAPFTNPQDMTNWAVLYMKGTVEAGTSKTPAYARNAIAQYKTEQGIETRRGPKRRVIRLDALDQVNVKDIPADQIEALLALAHKVEASQPTTASVPA